MASTLGIALLLAGLGCERNSSTPYLVPTGIRPPLANPAGTAFGILHYAPLQRPDLVDPPYPPTRMELVLTRDSSLFASQLLPTQVRQFQFSNVQPGEYFVRAIARGFDTTLVRVVVADRPRDVGDMTLPVDFTVYSSLVGLVGTIAGYDPDSYYSNLFNTPLQGVWNFPSDFHSDPTVQVPAGTYHFMFVTDNSFPNDLLGWGGDSTVVLSVPVVNQPVTLGHGPAHDLKITFPAAGAYNFVLDEARQTCSVSAATAATGMAATRATRLAPTRATRLAPTHVTRRIR